MQNNLKQLKVNYPENLEISRAVPFSKYTHLFLIDDHKKAAVSYVKKIAANQFYS